MKQERMDGKKIRQFTDAGEISETAETLETAEILKEDIIIPEIVIKKANLAFEEIKKEQAEQKQSARKAHKKFPRKKVCIIAAAAVLAASAVTAGASAYMKWSRSFSEGMQATEKVMKKAEETKLAAFVNQTVECNGIKVTAEQSIVDSHNALISFKVEGFKDICPETVQPFFGENRIWLDGYNYYEDGGDDPEKYYSMYAGVYNGYITNEYGKPVKAADGTTPMENAENGTYGYFGEDGSFQWDISLTNNNREGTFFDMPIHIELKDLGYADKSDFEPLVEGTWSFDWVLTGSDEIKRVELDVPLGDTGVKVTKAEISPISLSVWLKNKGFGTGETPNLRGVKMKDGTLLPYLYLGPGAESPSYITFVIDRILDVDEVEALIFRKNYPEEGQAYTEEDLYIVPINE